MASRISRLRSLTGAQFRSFSNEDTLVKRITNLAARRWMPSMVLMSLIRYGSHTAAQYSSLEALAKIVFIFQKKSNQVSCNRPEMCDI